MFALGWGLALQVYSTHVSAAPPRDDPSAVSVIELGLPGQAGAPSAYKVSLAEVLAGQPGVQIRSSGGLGQWSGAILRGADSSQVAVLIDGVPLQRGVQSAVDLSQLPVDGAERVEIYRGVPPLDVGIDAIGGAINLVTRRGRGLPTVWALLGSGSFGLRKVSVGHVGERDGLHIAATASYQGATGDFPYFSTGGLLYSNNLFELRRRNDGFDQVSADLRLTQQTRHGSFFVGAQGLLKQQGVAGIGQALAQPGQPTLAIGRALLSGGGQADLGGGRMQLAVDGHVLLERTAYRDPGIAPPANSEQLSEQGGARIVLRLHSSPLAAGASPPERTLVLLGEARYEHLGSDELCPAPRTDCPAALRTASERIRGLFGLGGELHFGQAPPSGADRPAHSSDRLLLQPGVHFLVARSVLRQLATSPTPSDEPIASEQLFLAPRLAARLHVARWLLLRASGGRFVRLPTFLELFGDRAFFRPSLSLRPESAWLAELGGRASGSLSSWVQLSLEAHGFARLVDDLITVVRDGPILRAANVGQALAAGVELEGQLRLRELASVQLNYTFLDARDRTLATGHAGNLLPNRPPHSVFLRAELGYRAWRVAYELDYTSLLYLDPGNLQPRPGRALHALRLQSGPHRWLHLSLALELRNLADTRTVPVTLSLAGGSERQVPLSDIFDYPLPGRSLYATLSGRL